MLKKRSKVQKRLAKVVMAALLCTNAAQAVWVPAVAEATEITLTDSNYTSLTQTKDISSPRFTVRYPNDSAVTTVNVEFTDSFSGSWQNLTGGYSSDTDVQGKTVNFKSGTFNGYFFPNGVSGGTSGDGTSKPIGNTVNVSGGKVSHVSGGMSLYNYIAHESFAEGNTVNISGDAEVGYVYGAYAHGNADIHKNTVNISSGKVTNIVGGGFSFRGGDANENTVNITGGTISSTIVGGRSDSGYADNNKVNISGGTISKGTTGYYAYIYGGSGSTSASNNTVTIKSAASISERIFFIFNSLIRKTK